MIKFLYSIASTAMLLVIVGCSSTKLSEKKICGLPAYDLQNKYLSLSIIPQSNGRISALDYRPDNLVLLQPYSENSKTISPLLPKTVFSNKNGYKIWLWGKKTIPNCKLKVTKTGKNEHEINIAMHGRYYMSQPFIISRDISLPHRSTVINIKTKMLNISDKTEKIMLWINSVPNEIGETVYPAKSGIKYVQRRSVKQVKTDMLLKQNNQTSSNFFVAPAQAWIARIFPKNKVIMAYITETKNIIPGGLLYTWNGHKEGKLVTSLEMIFAPIKLLPKQSVEFKTRIMVFKGLKNIKAICGDIALDCSSSVTGDKLKVKMWLNSVNFQTKLKINVGLLAINNSQTLLCREQHLLINKLSPGENSSCEFTIPTKRLSGTYYLSGNINGKKFAILEKLSLN